MILAVDHVLWRGTLKQHIKAVLLLIRDEGLFGTDLIAAVGFGSVERFIGAVEGALRIFAIAMQCDAHTHGEAAFAENVLPIELVDTLTEGVGVRCGLLKRGMF